MFTRREATALLLGGVAATLTGKLFAADDKKAVGPDPKLWDTVVDKAVAYFRKTQGADGSWSGKESPGVTGIVVTGMLQTGRVGPKDDGIRPPPDVSALATVCFHQTIAGPANAACR